MFTRGARALAATALIAAILVCIVGWLPASPFGGSFAKATWSKCGQDLCSCQPDAADPTDPLCPLCPPDNGCVETSSCALASGIATVSWTRTAERLDSRVPMSINLLTASLMLRLWAEPIVIQPPVACEVIARADNRVAGACSILIDPPPPRRAVV